MSSMDDDEEYDDDRPRRRRRRKSASRYQDKNDDDYYDDEHDEDSDDGDDPSLRYIVPIGVSGWAIAAGYLALLSVLCVPAPFALIAALLAILDMKRHPKKRGMGRAVFGLIMGGFFSLVLAFFAVAVIAQAIKGK